MFAIQAMGQSYNYSMAGKWFFKDEAKFKNT